MEKKGLKRGGIGKDVEAGVVEFFFDQFLFEEGHFFELECFAVIKNHRQVGLVHRVLVLGKEVAVEAAEGVQFHHSYEGAGRILLFQGVDSGAEFGGGVSEVFINKCVIVAAEQLEAVSSAFEGGNGFVELTMGDAELSADLVGAGNVLEVVFAEHFEGVMAGRGGENGSVLLDVVWVSVVGGSADVFFIIPEDVFQLLVAGKPGDEPSGLYAVGEFAELVDVAIVLGKDVDVVPSNAGEESEVGVVIHKLGFGVDGRSEIFVAFEDDERGGFGDADAGVEAFHLCSHHVIEIISVFFQHVHDHGGDGGFAMAAGNDDALFVFGNFVEVFGKGVDAQAELLGFE